MKTEKHAAYRSWPSSRDLAEQATTLRSIISANDSALSPFLAFDATDAQTSPTAKGTCVFYNPAEMEARKAMCGKTRETEILAELERAESFGPQRSIVAVPDASRLLELQRDFPHMSAVVKIVERRVALSRLGASTALRMPPILLSGPPGVGKTAFASALASSFGAQFKRVDIASATAGFALTGSHSTWGNAKAGAVWNLLQAGSAVGVILLDEIDKQGSSSFPVLGGLYAMLERQTAARFRDEFVDLPVDASHIIWLATCNQPMAVDAAIRSRFVHVEVPMPSAAEMVGVVASIHRSLRTSAPWSSAFAPDLPAEVFDLLAACAPREVLQLLEDAYANAAADSRRTLCARDVARQAIPITRRIGFV